MDVGSRSTRRRARAEEAWPSLRILGSRVHLVDNNEVLSAIERWMSEETRTCHFIVNTGFHGLEVARRDPEFRAIVNSADLYSPDGIATVLLSRLRRRPLRERATSAELMTLFFQRAHRQGYSSYFLGDTPETLSRLRANLARTYPGHRIAGTFSPPFRENTEAEEAEVVRRINEARPDVLWVGLGLPKQERWIYRNKHRLRVPAAIGVGACFGFFSGRVKRAPLWIGRMGLEWLWRLANEPGKLWRRNLHDGPRFLLHAALELGGLRRYD